MDADSQWPVGFRRIRRSLGVAGDGAVDAGPWSSWLLCCRVLWQMAILVLYTSVATVSWRRALLAVAVALFIASNILFAARIDHLRWPDVRRTVVIVETGIGLVAACALIQWWPLGPACLLLLPGLVTYAWLNALDAWQVTAGLATIGLYGLTIIRSMRQSATFATGVPPLSVLLLAAYSVILWVTVFIGYLLQRQRAESHHLMRAMAQVETQAAQLEQANQRIQDYADRVYVLAAAEERNRIAGEIHDTVAHRLTALLVQLQAARRILTQSADICAVADNLQVCEALARESLDEVRRSVRAIHQSPGDSGVQALRRLTLEYMSLTGMEVRFSVDPALDPLPGKVLSVLYRVIQEGLTNAQRHGRATQVDITLYRTGYELGLDLVDNGRGALAPAYGFGLSTMRERVRAIGGDLHISSQPGQGFRLSLRLPMWEGVST
jgi:signal transduction histidine kinase